MALYVAYVIYGVILLITLATFLTDSERLRWYEIIGITLCWPIAFPAAMCAGLAKNIREIKEKRREERRLQVVRFCTVIRKLELISSEAYLWVCRYR